MTTPIKNTVNDNFWIGGISGTVSITGTVNPSLVYPVPAPSGSVADNSRLTSFSGNVHLHQISGGVGGGSRDLYEIIANNQTGSALYFQVYATSSLPVNGAVPQLSFQVLANSVFSISYRTAVLYPNGFSFAWSNSYDTLATGTFRQVQAQIFYR